MHHTDVDGLDDRADITDFYIFQKPNEPGKSILIMNVNFEAPAHADAFSEEASYEWKIDVNGDAREEIAFHVVFHSKVANGQTADVYGSQGTTARESGRVGDVIFCDAPVSFGHVIQVTTVGDYRFYAGLRSDPFFGDPIGLKNNMQWTGDDYFAGKNVFGIVLEVPNTALGTNPQIGIWAQIMVSVHGSFTAVNRMGRPGRLQGLLGSKAFNATHPSQHRDLFLDALAVKFQEFGYGKNEALALAMDWLPDILPYNYDSGAGFPNGRGLVDEVGNNWWRLESNGAITSDLLAPHTDYLTEFPYLGQPHW